MTPKELADALEKIDEEAFASLLLKFELSRWAKAGQDDDHRCSSFFGPARTAYIASAARRGRLGLAAQAPLIDLSGGRGRVPDESLDRP